MDPQKERSSKVLQPETFASEKVLVPTEHTLKRSKALKDLFRDLKHIEVESMTVTVSIDLRTMEATIKEVKSVCGADGRVGKQERRAAAVISLLYGNLAEVAAEGIASAIGSVPSETSAIYAEVEVKISLKRVVVRNLMFRFDGIDVIELT